MKQYKKYITLLALWILFNSIAFTQQQDNFPPAANPPKWLVGVKISTFGFALEGSRSLTRKLSLRTGISYLSYDYPLEKIRDDMIGTVNVAPSGVLLTLDYWLHKNIFFAAGAVLNSSKIAIDGKLAESVFIGDIEMYPDEVGLIQADVEPDKSIAPFIGIGFGSSHYSTKKLSYTIDFGILFHGRPSVKLGATGMLTPTANEAQAKLIEENISTLTFYPVVSFSIYYNIL